MTYKRNFLDRVIVHCQLHDQWEIKDELPSPLKSALLKIAPIVREAITQNTTVTIEQSTGTTIENSEQAKKWFFSNPEKGYAVSIAHDYFSIEYTLYKSIDELKELLEKIILEIKEELGEFIVKKLGVRYVDIFQFGTEDPLDWDKYISKEYLVTTDTLPPEADRKNLSRAFNRMEYTYPDEMQVIINYGIHNPNYPAPIRLRQYILDTDIQSLGLFNSDELRDKVDQFQVKANEIFESAITEKVRSLMNE